MCEVGEKQALFAKNMKGLGGSMDTVGSTISSIMGTLLVESRKDNYMKIICTLPKGSARTVRIQDQMMPRWKAEKAADEDMGWLQ